MLIGNKEDIPHGDSNTSKDFADKFGILYRECSALQGTQVSEVFDELAAKMVKNFGEGSN